MKQRIRGGMLTTFSLILLSFFIISCNKEGANNGSNPPKTNDVPDEFVGTWYYGDPSFTEYNYNDGSWSNAVGRAQFFRFFKDGIFETAYQNYFDNGYGCVLISGTYRKGTFTVEGNKLTLYDTKAKALAQNSCQPANDYDRDMEKENGEIIFAERGTDAYGTEGIYLSSPGYSQTFYRKE